MAEAGPKSIENDRSALKVHIYPKLGDKKISELDHADVEALLNAMQHGNLEMSSELKEKDERGFQTLLQQRRREKPYLTRRVYVTARESPAEATYVIRDEGPGFDPSKLPDPTDPSNLDRVSGRGLLLIRTFMDKVHHNTNGNEITMVKRRDR